MIAEPQIVEARERPAAVVRVRIPRAEIVRHMDAAMEELFGTLRAQHIPPAGPAFARHYAMSAEAFDLDVGVPVETPVTPTGRVTMGTLPGGRVARTVYTGRYEGLYEAWQAFGAWMAEQGLTPAAGLWECYLTDPSVEPDESRHQTELNRVLA